MSIPQSRILYEMIFDRPHRGGFKRDCLYDIGCLISQTTHIGTLLLLKRLNQETAFMIHRMTVDEYPDEADEADERPEGRRPTPDEHAGAATAPAA